MHIQYKGETSYRSFGLQQNKRTTREGKRTGNQTNSDPPVALLNLVLREVILHYHINIQLLHDYFLKNHRWIRELLWIQPLNKKR